MEDPFFHKTLTLRAGHRRLSLAVSQELFSSHTIDTGTLRLLKSIDPSVVEGERVLDVGCGYGPLALGLAAMDATAVDAVDRDALAVHYTAMNAHANELGCTVDAIASLGFDDLGSRHCYGLIVSNVPGKMPPPATEEFIVGAARHLSPTGLLAVVVVAPLAESVAAMLDRAAAEIEHLDASAQYTVLHATFAGTPRPRVAASGFERGVYDRGSVEVRSGLRVRTVHGIHEFDQLGFHTIAALRLIGDRSAGRVAVVNPGQGHLAAAAVGADAVTLVDRDLLALRNSAANLAGRTVDLRHTALLQPLNEVETAIVALRPKEPTAVHKHQLEAVSSAERVILTGTARAVARAIEGRRVRRSERYRGHLAVELVG